MTILTAVSLTCALVAHPSARVAGGDEWTIRAATVYPVSGAPIANGVVRVEKGKITAVGKGGSGGEVLE